MFRGVFFETDFASFLTWRDFGFPDASIVNGFAMAALCSSDGAYVLGRMATHTSNAGLSYFPSGTPDLQDVRADGTVDLSGSVERELTEETGLLAADIIWGQGWHAVAAGPQIALMRPVTARKRSSDLIAHIRAHIARESEPELCDAVAVRGPADLDPSIPDFVKAYLAAVRFSGTRSAS